MPSESNELREEEEAEKHSVSKKQVNNEFTNQKVANQFMEHEAWMTSDKCNIVNENGTKDAAQIALCRNIGRNNRHGI